MALVSTKYQWATQLASVAQKNHKNEASLRHALYTVLHPYVIEHVGLDEAAIRHEGTSKSGRFDSLFGGTLIEYKSPGELETKSKRRHHAGQALRYLRDERIGAAVVLLTDGLVWGILRDVELDDDEAQPTLDFVQPLQVPDDERFQWRDNSVATAMRVLDLLDTLRFDRVTPESLMNRLGPSTTQAREVLAQLSDALVTREKGSRTDILFTQWVALAGVSYGIGSESSPWPEPRQQILGDLSGILPKGGYAATIFVLHTYIAVCSKMMAAEALALTRSQAENRPSQWTSLSGKDFDHKIRLLESGELAASMRAPRLMGGDLFGWYADELAGRDQLRAAMRELYTAFSQLAWARLAHATRVTGDLLRDFYIGIVPRKMRKSLGEFFTPQWIAERIVDKAFSLSGLEPTDKVRYLDPTCGSGTFLVAALRRVVAAATSRGLSPGACAEEAVESVNGFDINPVSPLMARVNLLLALGDLADELPEISFNVYQADSILIPEEPVGEVTFDQADSALAVPLVIGEILLPPSLATITAISGLAQLIDVSIQRNRTPATFLARLKTDLPHLGVSSDDVTSALDAAALLYAKLQTLHIEGKDGVWAHVIEQSFAPRVLGQVDIVVGNPPWISWKHLPEVWRTRSESTWKQWGLWQTKRFGGGTPMADISSLLLARCVATYAPKGIVALLLPEGILINEPGGRAIRSTVMRGVDGQVINSFNPMFVDDFSTLNPFTDASNKPVALYVRAGEKASFPIDALHWKRAAKGSSLPVHVPLVKMLGSLSRTESTLEPIDSVDTGSKWRPPAGANEIEALSGPIAPSYTWGQGFHTRGADGIFYCEVLSDKPTSGGLVRIRTRPDLGRNTRAIDSIECFVEAEFLWPLLRGSSVGPFHVTESSLYCIVPHLPEKLSQPITTSALIARGPRLYDYLENHIPRLVSRSAYDLKLTDESPWGIQGTAWRHMGRLRALVVCRYMEPSGRPPAAVAMPQDDPRLGLRTTMYPNNKVNFVGCESLSQADYVAAFVNSGPVQDLIQRLSSTTTISPSTMNRIGIPIFDSDIRVHRDLSALGQECRLDPTLWESLREEAAALVRLARHLT